MTTELRRPFDLAGPLPRGLGVLEASAGTGKTYALSALAVRYIAEAAVPAAALCIVSFTEAATAELRGRVRSRLVEVAGRLERGDGAPDDPVAAAVLACDASERILRLERLRQAVADFDAATISTIHGLCGRVLTMAGRDLGVGVVTDGLADIEEVVNDIVIARYGDAPDDLVPADRLVQVVRLALAVPDAELFAPPDDIRWRAADCEQQRRRVLRAREVVREAVAEVLRRRALRSRRTFDGMLTETRAALRGRGGASLVAQLRERYSVVLIDEFQDTDRVQWDIFADAFVRGGSPTTVVLVGDPKQSIYRFRSADLGAYLDAVGAAGDQVWSLGVNRRSDAPLLQALDRVLAGTTFGDERVRFETVAAAPENGSGRLDAPALEIRDVVTDTKSAPLQRRLVAEDVVRTVASLLTDGTRLDTPDGPRLLRAGDIAVLTRSNLDAADLALRLNAAGVPAATASSQSVLETEAARQWQVLFRALERPGSAGAARAAALGWFVGHTVEQVAAFADVETGDDAVSALHDLLVGWSQALVAGGLPRLLALARAHGLHERVLARSGGARLLTDLDHVAELLQSYTGGARVGPTALLAALDALRDPDGEEAIAREALARRIDRDDDAVQLLTVHSAKGLEFGIVLCPYLWTVSTRSGPRHTAVEGGRAIDCTWLTKELTSTQKGVTLDERDKQENDGEALRLLYVALTRAKHRLVLWYPGNCGSKVLGGVLAAAIGAPVDSSTLRLLDGACDRAIAVRAVDPDAAVPSVPHSVDASGVLEVAVARRHLDDHWRPWSFSGLKREAEAVLVPDDAVVVAPGSIGDLADEPPVLGGVDERPPDPEPMIDPDEDQGPTPLASAPGGTTFGTLVHDVFEAVDFTSESLADDLVAECAERLHYRRLPITATDLAAGLLPALHSPLGGPEGERRLVDIGRADRLDEMAFHLPLARFEASRLGSVLADHLPDDDPFRSWFAHLGADGYAVDIDGLLTGSIDLVARTADRGRYWLADYKTNQLGLTSAYDTHDLADAMVHHHYPLQAALYLVALHRYLSGRVPGYEPAQQLLGAAYLFVRGMQPQASPPSSASDGVVPGVFWWRPPVAAIVALDELLAVG